MKFNVDILAFLVGCIALMGWAIASLIKGKQYKKVADSMDMHTYQMSRVINSCISQMGIMMDRLHDQYDGIIAAQKGVSNQGKLSYDQLNSGFPILAVRFAYAVWRDPYAAYVWKSLLHSDSTPCEDCFILGIGADPDKQILFEIPISLWDDAEFAKELPTALPCDSHSFTENMSRLNLYIRL